MHGGWVPKCHLWLEWAVNHANTHLDRLNEANLYRRHFCLLQGFSIIYSCIIQLKGWNLFPEWECTLDIVQTLFALAKC